MMTFKSFSTLLVRWAMTGNILRVKKSGTNFAVFHRCTPACHTSVLLNSAAFSGRATAKTNSNQLSCTAVCGTKTLQNAVASHRSASSSTNRQSVVDNVGGRDFESMLQVMRRGGRYVSSGAIGGPIVNLDLRTFYLKDLTLVGCTAWDEPVFKSLVDYIEGNKIVPLVAKTFALQEIVKAQTEFLEKKHFGKFVLVPEH
ncbi:MAG: hypothetical protein EBY08_06385 [Actinobacteria bacterium]|nr:hypothetical protein [Actinomycetota bacterium]